MEFGAKQLMVYSIGFVTSAFETYAIVPLLNIPSLEDYRLIVALIVGLLGSLGYPAVIPLLSLVYGVESFILPAVEYNSLVSLNTLIPLLLLIVGAIIIPLIQYRYGASAGLFTSALSISAYVMAPFYFLLLGPALGVKEGNWRIKIFSIFPLLFITYFDVSRDLLAEAKIVAIIILFLMSSVLLSLNGIFSLSGIPVLFGLIFLFTNDLRLSIIGTVLGLIYNVAGDVVEVYRRKKLLKGDITTTKNSLSTEIVSFASLVSQLTRAYENQKFLESIEELNHLRDEVMKCGDRECLSKYRIAFENEKTKTINIINEKIYNRLSELKEAMSRAKALGVGTVIEVDIFGFDVLDHASIIKVQEVNRKEEEIIRLLLRAFKNLSEYTRDLFGVVLENPDKMNSLMLVETLEQTVKSYQPRLEKCVNDASSLIEKFAGVISDEELKPILKRKAEFDNEIVPLSKFSIGYNIVKNVNDLYSKISILMYSSLEKFTSEVKIESIQAQRNTLLSITSNYREAHSLCERIGILNSFEVELWKVTEIYKEIQQLGPLVENMGDLLSRIEEEINGNQCVNLAEYGLERGISDIVKQYLEGKGVEVSEDKDNPERICKR